MALLIIGERDIYLSYPRLVRVRRNKKPMELTIQSNAREPGSTERKLWIRFQSFDDAPGQLIPSLSFIGYISESYMAMENRPFDELDQEKTQFVRGMIAIPMGTGKIWPAYD